MAHPNGIERDEVLNNYGPPIGLLLGYEGNQDLSVASLTERAAKLEEYLKASKPSYLCVAIPHPPNTCEPASLWVRDLQFGPEGPNLTALGRLDLTFPHCDMIPGIYTSEKTAAVVHNLLEGIAAQCAPLTQSIELSPDVVNEWNFRNGQFPTSSTEFSAQAGEDRKKIIEKGSTKCNAANGGT